MSGRLGRWNGIVGDGSAAGGLTAGNASSRRSPGQPDYAVLMLKVELTRPELSWPVMLAIRAVYPIVWRSKATGPPPARHDSQPVMIRLLRNRRHLKSRDLSALVKGVDLGANPAH